MFSDAFIPLLFGKHDRPTFEPYINIHVFYFGFLLSFVCVTVYNLLVIIVSVRLWLVLGRLGPRWVVFDTQFSFQIGVDNSFVYVRVYKIITHARRRGRRNISSLSLATLSPIGMDKHFPLIIVDCVHHAGAGNNEIFSNISLVMSVA